MACNNGKKGFHSPYGMITDLNITYTGCSTTCNGEEIKPGMRLREILDILIGNCSEGGSATWGDIIGNIEDQTDLVQFIQDNISVANWGSILGDIEDQEDLVQYIADNGFSEDKVGLNLNLGADGKLNAGVDVSGGFPGAVIFSSDGMFPSNGGYMLLASGLGVGAQISSSGEQLHLNSSGGNMTLSTEGGDVTVNTGAGVLKLLRDSQGVQSGLTVNEFGAQLSTSGADTRVSAFNGNVVISPGSSGSGYYALIGANNIQDTNRPVNANTYVVLGAGTEVSGFNNIDGGVTFDFYNRASSTADRVGVRHIYRRDSSNNRAVVLQLYKEGYRVDHSTFVEYESGMPDEAFISDEVLPTIGYVRDTLVADAISGLQAQITALEARIEALENA